VEDRCQILVDEIVRGHGAAAESGDRLERWLVDTGVLSPDLTDCVFGHPLGHPPGPSYGRAVGRGDAPRTWTNGGYVLIGRRAHWGGGLDRLACRQCGRLDDVTADGLRWQQTFMSTIAEWMDGGDGTITCLGCGARNELGDWDWGSHPWGFGEVSLVLWNWAPLAQRFIDDVGDVLGHPVRYLGYEL
jgi:hypothetical protein